MGFGGMGLCFVGWCGLRLGCDGRVARTGEGAYDFLVDLIRFASWSRPSNVAGSFSSSAMMLLNMRFSNLWSASESVSLIGLAYST